MDDKRIDPAEEWLGKQWLGNLFDLLPLESVRTEIKRRLYKYVYELLEKTGQRDPPFEPRPLCPYRRIIKLVETTLDGVREGILIPTVGGFILKIEKNVYLFRKRLNFAHEIGHTFFYDLEADIPTIRFQRSASRFWVQEGYASEIARAILMPKRSVIHVVGENKLLPSMASLRKLSKLYEVSYDALRLRLVNDLKIWDCIIFKSQRDAENSIKTKRFDISKGISYQKWRIPTVLRKDIASHEVLYSALHSVFSEGEVVNEIFIRNDKYLFQSMLLEDGSHNKCISIILQRRCVKKRAL